MIYDVINYFFGILSGVLDVVYYVVWCVVIIVR